MCICNVFGGKNAPKYVAVFKLDIEISLVKCSQIFFDKVNIIAWIFL